MIKSIGEYVAVPQRMLQIVTAEHFNIKIIFKVLVMRKNIIYIYIKITVRSGLCEEKELCKAN